jgi:ribosomal silencing factor RsfS
MWQILDLLSVIIDIFSLLIIETFVLSLLRNNLHVSIIYNFIINEMPQVSSVKKKEIKNKNHIFKF